MKASVVIPTYQGRRTLPAVLDGLARQTEPGFETVLVSDGAKPAWMRRLRATFPLRILEQAHAGAGPARNLGAREARSPLLIFLADDVVPDAFFVESHLREHRGRPRAAVGVTAWHPALALTPLMRRIAPAGDLTPFHLIRDQRNLDYDFLYGSNLSMPRDLALRFPFDPRFSGYGWEDTELGYRLRRAGVRLVLAPKAVGWHVHRYTQESWAWRRRKARQAFVRFLGMHPEEGARLVRSHKAALANRERQVASVLKEARAAMQESRARRAEAARLEAARRLAERGALGLRREARRLTRLLPLQLESKRWAGAVALGGWHPWEDAGTREPFRWSSERASLRLPPGRWEMEIGVTPGTGVRRLEVRLPGRPPFSIALQPGRIRIPLGRVPAGALVRLRVSPPGRAPGDPRVLGVQLFALRPLA